MRAILYEMEYQACATLGDDSLAGIWPGILERAGPGNAFRGGLARWAEADSGPLVTEGRSWDEKVFRRDEAAGGVPVTVWGM